MPPFYFMIHIAICFYKIGALQLNKIISQRSVMSFNLSSPIPPDLQYEVLLERLQKKPLLRGKRWKLSPFPWPLTETQLEEVKAIGRACLEFYKVAERLYLASYHGHSLLRNRELFLPWVADYYNRGKPERLVQHGLYKGIKGVVPMVIRPDLLLTEEGWALTELDCVPGGVGLTAQLYSVYEKFFPMAGGSELILNNFYAALKNLTPEVENSLIAIVVHEDSATYWDELEWLANHLQALGKRVVCIQPTDIKINETGVFLKESNQKVDTIYRFFELFDVLKMPNGEGLLGAIEEGKVKLTPVCKTFQEEKLSFGLFHHYRLKEFWEENLSAQSLTLLRKVMPKTWVLDPTPIPVNGVLWGPLMGGQWLKDWSDLGHLTHEERNFVLKISGFHETAWGARGVTLGEDVSKAEWDVAVKNGLNMWEKNPFILQDYKKPKRLSHFAYSDNGCVEAIEGRLRLSPYYMVVNNEAHYVGSLSTICPANKKIIHGMTEALLLPCALEDSPS